MIHSWANLTVQERRDTIMDLQSISLQEEANGNSVDIETREYNCNGVYAREMRAPAGAFIVGEIHKEDHLTILQSGEITVFTDRGKERLIGPITFEDKAGVKRMGLTHTPVVWTSLHATRETDIKAIRKECIVDSYDELEKLNVVGSNSSNRDHSSRQCISSERTTQGSEAG